MLWVKICHFFAVVAMGGVGGGTANIEDGDRLTAKEFWQKFLDWVELEGQPVPAPTDQATFVAFLRIFPLSPSLDATLAEDVLLEFVVNYRSIEQQILPLIMNNDSRQMRLKRIIGFCMATTQHGVCRTDADMVFVDFPDGPVVIEHVVDHLKAIGQFVVLNGKNTENGRVHLFGEAPLAVYMKAAVNMMNSGVAVTTEPGTDVFCSYL
jgi:hypothetical protein